MSRPDSADEDGAPRPDGADTQTVAVPADALEAPPLAAGERRILAIELAVVLFVTWIPTLLYARGPDYRASPDARIYDVVGAAGWIALAGYLGWRRGYLLRPGWSGRWANDAFRGVVVAVGMLDVGVLFVELVGGWTSPVPALSGGAAWAYLVTMSVGEEVLWRGYAFGAVRALAGPTAAVFATSALFAAYHPYGPLDTLSIALVGLLLGSLRAAGAGLVALSVGHVLCNVVLEAWSAAARSA